MPTDSIQIEGEKQMRLEVKDCPVPLAVPKLLVKHLRTTRFRGSRKKYAGNFSRWDVVTHLFTDDEFVQKLAEQVRQAIRDERTTARVTFDFVEPIGWSVSGERAQYLESDLEEFELIRAVKVWRVKPECTHLLAPRTSLVTLEIKVGKYLGDMCARIRSIYPGPDVGDPEEALSDRERVVLFDRNHPGA